MPAHHLTATLPLVVLFAAACSPGAPTAGLTRPPEFAPEGQTKCGVTKSQSRPLIVEWPASDRATLESQSRRGRVVVRYSGCELEVLRHCRVAGEYEYTALTPKRETVSIRNADDLYAHIPVHAAKFEAALERSGELNVSMTIVGMYESLAPPPRRDELDGDCGGATHVINALTVGAFEFYAGASTSAEASAKVLSAAAGARSSSARETLSNDGQDTACRQAAREDVQPPDGCGGLLRIEVVPVGQAVATASKRGPQKAKALVAKHQRVTDESLSPPTPQCSAGQQLVDGRCLDPTAEPRAELAPEDRGYRDTQGGAGWGNRCFGHVRARRLTHARAACNNGLEMNPVPAIHGAILYSLAVTEELAGEPRRACALLIRSLDVRPGNDATEAKRDALGCAAAGGDG
ncbi:MAG: hypothetical protein JRI68_22960 [Deltaproteobacteria bacterium]|nr:hypothetical protein [Deltaproteobacteria bacterium]